MRDPRTQSRARKLRHQLTDSERCLWRYLRRHYLDGHRFRRQVPMGPYIADFACLDPALIIEVDGGQHQSEQGYDSARDAYLAQRGFRILRFWSNEVLAQTEAVLEVIRRTLQEEEAKKRPS